MYWYDILFWSVHFCVNLYARMSIVTLINCFCVVINAKPPLSTFIEAALTVLMIFVLLAVLSFGDVINPMPMRLHRMAKRQCQMTK
jgi:hypothetical protein